MPNFFRINIYSRYPRVMRRMESGMAIERAIPFFRAMGNPIKKISEGGSKSVVFVTNSAIVCVL